ncbi:MAG: recombinase family protein, partial [Candidatus Thermoplasmatota archaeon]|nr:recombinase family protein [Candidatus Thermoplasmatota archaeon]
MQAAAPPQPEKKRVAAIYARVSTAEQTNNYSLETQVKHCRSHAQAQGWRHRIYRDPGHSASNMDRPGLEQLIADAEKRRVNIILVHRLDRLSRSILDFAQLYAYLQEYGVDVVSTTEPINTTDEIGRFFMYQLINFAQLERELFKRRSITGKRARAHDKKWHGGTPPYGYTYNQTTGHL